MNINTNSYYQALCSRDNRFDGQFFAAVITTKIYCRPICPAKTPKFENCRFFYTAAAAEKLGFRPCLRCRPELAPGSAPIDSANKLVFQALSLIESSFNQNNKISEITERLGISERHLRRILEAELGASPLEIIQTQRMLTAKQLLTDTNLSITEIAYASGFSSLRRFNDFWQKKYNTSPSEFRKKTNQKNNFQDFILCQLYYRPPFDWSYLLNFLSKRSLTKLELVKDNKYLRTISIGKHKGWIEIAHCKNSNYLLAKISNSLSLVYGHIIAGIKNLFDLKANPNIIYNQLANLPNLNQGLRIPGTIDSFELACRAILGQQVSVQAACTLAERIIDKYGEDISSPYEELTKVWPSPEKLANVSVLELQRLGITNKRAHTLHLLSLAVSKKNLDLAPGVNIENTLAKLKSIPGIGDWTAQYIAMRALSFPDAFPESDLGIMKALNTKSAKESSFIAKQWSPWRAYAVLHLWKSLDNWEK